MAKPGSGRRPISYLGEHLRVVDPSHRLLLPVEWRPAGAPTEFTLLLWPVDVPEYLVVLPEARWEQFLEKLENMPLSDEESAEMERLIGLRAFACSMDQVGRLPLPEAATKALDIRDSAQLIGRITKFEISNPAKVTALLQSPDTKRLAQTLKQIRL